MKLLLSLILIIVCSISLSKAVNFKPNRNQFGSSESDCITTLQSLNGYHSGFEALSFNGNFQNGNQNGQASFFEYGYISVDFENQQVAVEYSIEIENQQIEGKTWMFANNQTQYIYTVPETGPQCIAVPYSGPFPSFNGITKYGDGSVGMIETEILTVPSSSSVSQYLEVDTKFCSPLTSHIVNSPSTAPGYTLMNFYGYQDSAFPADFNLPIECFESKVNNNVQIKSIKSYPNFLKKLN